MLLLSVLIALWHLSMCTFQIPLYFSVADASWFNAELLLHAGQPVTIENDDE